MAPLKPDWGPTVCGLRESLGRLGEQQMATQLLAEIGPPGTGRLAEPRPDGERDMAAEWPHSSWPT